MSLYCAECSCSVCPDWKTLYRDNTHKISHSVCLHKRVQLWEKNEHSSGKKDAKTMFCWSSTCWWCKTKNCQDKLYCDCFSKLKGTTDRLVLTSDKWFCHCLAHPLPPLSTSKMWTARRHPGVLRQSPQLSSLASHQFYCLLIFFTTLPTSPLFLHLLI